MNIQQNFIRYFQDNFEKKN